MDGWKPLFGVVCSGDSPTRSDPYMVCVYVYIYIYRTSMMGPSRQVQYIDVRHTRVFYSYWYVLTIHIMYDILFSIIHIFTCIYYMVRIHILCSCIFSYYGHDQLDTFHSQNWMMGIWWSKPCFPVDVPETNPRKYRMIGFDTWPSIL